MRRTSRTKYRRCKPKYTKRKIRRGKYGGFLKRYDFAYAGQDTANQAMKGLDSLAPKLRSNLKRNRQNCRGENKTT